MAEVVDRAARDRIARDLGTTLFVEAGAGSGKTTALVDRVLALVASGTVPLAAIAAITFTEKAGAELRHRLRRRLEEVADDRGDEPRDEPPGGRGSGPGPARPGGPTEADPGPGPGGPTGDDHPPPATGGGPATRGAAAACRAALDELDGAAIGTLHAFAQRILSEHPVEAGLPPHIEVLDEVTSGVHFERRWAAYRDQLLADPAYERTLLLLFAAGVRIDAVRALARSFNSNWDLVEETVPAEAPPPPAVADLLAGALDAVDAALAHRAGCADPGDRLARRLDEVADWVAPLRAGADDLALLDALTGPRPSFRAGNVGAAGAWGGREAKAEVVTALRAAGDALDAVTGGVATACAHHLGSALRAFTLAAAAERRRDGELEFHDLLVVARALLRHPEHGAEIRAALHRRYQRLLLDEFQDTDPIQVELAVRIAAAHPRSPEAGTAPWSEVEVAPGRLFVVGDPKQSIYRFRRADISLFLAAARRFGPPVGLTANFRTGAPVIDWVNATFGRLMADASLADSQPPYEPLHPVRPAPPVGPPVAVIGRRPLPPGTRAAELRAAEAAEVAATVGRAVTEGWSVDDGRGGWRPATLGDVTVLVPARTSLPFLEDALDAAGIPYRAEASSLVYATRAVRDLLMAVRAVADPTDELSVVSTLRSPLFGCGDDDLYRFRVERGGRWDLLHEQPATVPADDPVAAGLRALAAWHGDRHWQSPSALLDRIVEERRVLELAFAGGRPRDVWRRIRFVVDGARAWSDAVGGDLRDYLDWVGLQSSEGARVAEAVLPETDDDAVRIMTIHAAKGLEFPIAIVSGATTAPRTAVAPGEARFLDGRVAYYLGRNAETPEFAASRPVDEQMALDERIRLLYVAATRARDHLVVSTQRHVRATEPAAANRTSAELLVAGMGDLLDGVPDAAGDGTVVPPLPEPVTPPDPSWEAARHQALARARQPSTVAATALTDEGAPDVDRDDAGDGRAIDITPDGRDGGLAKRPRDLDLPPWLKGRYGTAVGRAVHGVLQTVDLAGADEDALAAAVAAQAQAEAVPDRAPAIRTLVDHALAAPSVRAASATTHWREVYVCTPIRSRLLEGYVDLLYRTPGGLVVVDYKTSATADPEELDRRTDRYRTQGASYALAVGRATGEPVTRVTFCFLTPDGAVERHLGDLDAAVAEVEAAVLRGTEVEMA